MADTAASRVKASRYCIVKNHKLIVGVALAPA
jgi:hypothetical protein